MNQHSSALKRRRKKLPFLVGVGWYLLFVVLLFLPAAGIIIAAGHTPRPRLLGWVLIATGLAAAIPLVDRWARILPGVFAPATLNGFIMLVDGHVLNQPNVPVSRWQSLITIMFTVAGTIITAPFTERLLNRTEEFASIGIWCCLVAALASVGLAIKHWETPVSIALTICFAAIIVARYRDKQVDTFR